MSSKDKLKGCITKGCDRPRKTRGLCASCYRQAMHKIEERETSDKQLVKLGLMLPKYADRSAFAVSFAERKA